MCAPNECSIVIAPFATILATPPYGRKQKSPLTLLKYHHSVCFVMAQAVVH